MIHHASFARMALGIAALGLAATVAPAAAAPIIRAPLGNVRAAQRAPQGYSATGYSFTTLDDMADPTFNQLLGINDRGLIAGYFGSGAAGHPNKGYTIAPPYSQADYTNENFPGSAQTQVTAINNKRDTAGFWVDNKGRNFGFIRWHGVYTSYRDPHTGKGTVNQLLGLNDNGIAVGFYTDASGVNHAYELDQSTGTFTAIVPPGGNNALATGINSLGDVVGFYTLASGNVVGFLLKGNNFVNLSFPGAMATNPLGINKKDEIVGSYNDASGALHGFTLTQPLGHQKWTSVDDPNGIGTTVVNGLNDKGDLVGFYTDNTGNTDGFLAVPAQ